MEFRPLDLKIISATDLKNVNTFSRMDPYVVVSISGDSKAKYKTPVHNNGGTNPRWDFTVSFTVNEADAQKNKLTLKFKIMEDGTFGDKEIGEVYVPVKELLDAKQHGEKVVSYAVRTSSGKSKGTLSFSYKFGEKYTVQKAVPPPPQAYGKAGEPVVAYPPPGHRKAGEPAVAYPPPAPGKAGEPAVAYPPPAPGKAGEPAVAYPPPSYGGSSSTYPPHGKSSGDPPVAYPPPPQAGYPYPHGSYPQGGGYGYPPPPPPGVYQYPAQPGYGYPQPGYGYPPQPGYPPVQPPKNKKNSGLGKMGLGLGAGLLGGLLLGEAVSDVADGVGDAADAFDGADVDFDF